MYILKKKTNGKDFKQLSNADGSFFFDNIGEVHSSIKNDILMTLKSVCSKNNFEISKWILSCYNKSNIFYFSDNGYATLKMQGNPSLHYELNYGEYKNTIDYEINEICNENDCVILVTEEYEELEHRFYHKPFDSVDEAESYFRNMIYDSDTSHLSVLVYPCSIMELTKEKLIKERGTLHKGK